METKDPLHIGVIMDGNRRWAKNNSVQPWKGHEQGKRVLKKLIDYFADKDTGTKYLTLYSLSLDNFTKRSLIERKFLYDIFKKGFKEILNEKKIFENKININVVGRWDLLPDKELKKNIQDAIDATKDHDKKFIRFAICYDGQDELVQATKKIIQENPNNITPETIKQNLFTKDLPPVDLVIRTGGEKRLSGFLIWDASYAELFFTDTLFPDSIPSTYEDAIEEYKNRQRRFGK